MNQRRAVVYGGVALLLIAVLFTILAGGRLPAAAQDGGQDDQVIDNFEGDNLWWSYDSGTVFECGLGGPGYESAGALHLDFDTGAGGSPGCGFSFESTAGWDQAAGLGFVWRGDPSGHEVTLVLVMRDPAQTNPDMGQYTSFEAYMTVPGDWWQVTVPWEFFHKADWIGDTGTDTLDVTQVSEIIFVVAGGQAGSIWVDDLRLLDAAAGPLAPEPYGNVPDVAAYDKFVLWTGPTQLRGANVWQRVVFPAFDGPEYLGQGHVGPPYTQDDFNRLAALGANYVNISGPGLFTLNPPYVVDEGVQANLDRLLDMIARADMFAVISARTGPGRSEFVFWGDDFTEWADPALLVDHLWTDQAAQDAWAEMWRYTADRYRDNPVVVGYDLLVEPASAGRLLGIWEPVDFYPAYAGTLYDWNQFYPRVVDAIREVDPDTPVLVGALGWSGVRWLPALQPVDDPRVVYMVHQYEPQDQYTHQWETPAVNTYPGRFDLTWDGVPDDFNRAWLDGFLSPINEFKARYGVPVGVNEYGVLRWVPNAADFIRDEMELFEARDLNHALWMFFPSWPPYLSGEDFGFEHGPDDLLAVIRANWDQNTVRPSNVGR
ncbi:MAG: cellulase family glycosylhydrolase [Anaerolineae bacterium]|nr:cellulase family glycosylhydrolase [Anaerolineae bacterium]